jgi:hypothetical protein
MTYGLYAQGDYSQVLFSSEADSLVFIGKPTFTRRSGFGYNNRYLSSQGSSGGTVFYNGPMGAFYEFTFDSGGKDAIFFSYTPYPYKCAIVATSRSGNTYSIVTVSQVGIVPQLYAFSKSSTVSNSGNGLAIYRADGSTAFTTKDKLLLINAFYYGNVQNSNVQDYSYGSIGRYVGNSNNGNVTTVNYLNPVDPINVPISKPIIYVTSPQSAIASANSGSYQTYFYELLGAFNNNTSQMELEWCTPSLFSNFRPITVVQSPARTGFFMVADGATFD